MKYVVKHEIPGFHVGDRVSDGDLSPDLLAKFCVPIADDAPAAFVAPPPVSAPTSDPSPTDSSKSAFK